MNVSLTPKLEKYVQSKVGSGRYGSASEVVREALRELEQRERRELKEFQAELDRRIASLDRGEGIDGEKFMADLRKRIKFLHKKSA